MFGTAFQHFYHYRDIILQYYGRYSVCHYEKFYSLAFQRTSETNNSRHFSQVSEYCSEVRIEEINCVDCQVKTYSSYYGDFTLKWLIGIAPSGEIIFISPVYGGRTSDKFITNDSGILNLLEPDDGVMVDEGFLIDDEVASVGCELIRPPFMEGKDRFSVDEDKENADIAQLRVHVERAIQRVKVFDILQGKLRRSLQPQAEKILTIICGLVNLQEPIIANNENFDCVC